MQVCERERVLKAAKQKKDEKENGIQSLIDGFSLIAIYFPKNTQKSVYALLCVCNVISLQCSNI